MTISQLFEGANVFVVPFWILAIAVPNWGVTRRVMSSTLPFVLLVGLYVYLFSQSLDAESAEALSNPKLADIARFFADETAAATGWVHFLVMDLFVGRWIYWEGQNTGVWTRHSLALCLFAGPLGLLSHLVTAWVTRTWFWEDEVSDTATEASSV